MTSITVTIAESLSPMPAKTFLIRHCGLSHTLWKRIKHSGTFRLNGQPVNAAQTLVHNGDRLSYHILRPCSVQPEALPLDIRFEDQWMLIVNKPAGQLVHPTTKESHGTLGNAVLFHYLQQGNAHAYHPVHRLDRATSGLILIAKEPQIQYQLSRNGIKRFQREYLALVTGCPDPPSGLIDAPIARDLPSIIKRKTDPSGKPARTHYCVEKSNGRCSLVHITLETGRTHQIRVHMASIGHPLLGDALYGGPSSCITRQALHACQLSLCHPVTGETIVVQAPMPSDMSRIVSDL